jgi:hypothetical protein
MADDHHHQSDFPSEPVGYTEAWSDELRRLEGVALAAVQELVKFSGRKRFTFDFWDATQGHMLMLVNSRAYFEGRESDQNSSPEPSVRGGASGERPALRVIEGGKGQAN